MRRILGRGVVLSLALLTVAPSVFPWGAFRGKLGLKVTDTHQLILSAAYNLLTSDPRMAGVFGIPLANGRIVRLEDILAYEGVDGSLRTLTPYGPGPDAEKVSLYSCHWFNPLTGQGRAVVSAYDQYLQFAREASLASPNEQAAIKGLAWSAHFLADMFVPYHLVGMPVEEAKARLAARNYIIGENEAGPAMLASPYPQESQPQGIVFDNPLTRALGAWWSAGWGADSNFKEALAVFSSHHQAAATAGGVNHIDWFDPWYWNGNLAASHVANPTDYEANIDPGQVLFSSHASYESNGHARFVEGGGYAPAFDRPHPYDALWKNAPPDYSFTGQAWQSQAWQVQDFVTRVAQRTRDNMELCWSRPEVGIRSSVEAVYTLWRSAFTALRPILDVGRDPARPNDGLVVQVIVQNHSYEACRDARIRMTASRGGAVVTEDVQSFPGPITLNEGGRMSWFVQVNPNEEWLFAVQVAGVYDRTPDLQYGVGWVPYRPDPQEVRQVRAVEEADAGDFVGQYALGDPARSQTTYHGSVVFNADGTFTSVEFLDGRRIDGKGSWTFEPAGLVFTISWSPGGRFRGETSGNTADFAIAGHWSDGKAGTLRIYR